MHVDEEKWDSSLLQKYVLGLCDLSEKKEVESLIEADPELAKKIAEMHKAVKCYCTSCYTDKVKSILHGKGNKIHCKSAKQDARLLNLNEENRSAGPIQKVTSFLRSFLPFSGW